MLSIVKEAVDSPVLNLGPPSAFSHSCNTGFAFAWNYLPCLKTKYYTVHSYPAYPANFVTGTLKYDMV